MIDVLNLEQSNTSFDVTAWLENAATSANHGCGQVYELFEERLFGAIDGMLHGLPSDQRELLRAKAFKMFGYRDPAIIAAETAVIRDEELELGYRRTCVHHLELTHDGAVSKVKVQFR